MRALQLIAGKTARARIEANGLTPSLVRAVIGASGGPKWLVLAGLDRLLFTEWLPEAEQPIDMIGSSIGAWRMTMASHPDPARMYQRFLDAYMRYSYTKGESVAQTTRNSYELLQDVFDISDARAIVGNPKRRLNIVAVRARGLCGSSSPFLEGVGLLVAAARNVFSRESLARHFERAVFYTGENVALDVQWRDYGRLDIPLLAEALEHAVMASGSIPAVIDPIANIPGAPKGAYRDGGIIDYHFDTPWRVEEGIILYPHFYGHLVPGWFDKALGRRSGADVLDHMLVLAPTDEFVASLPGGARTDRKDFLNFSDAERQARWRSVVQESSRLADEMAGLLTNHDQLMDSIVPAT